MFYQPDTRPQSRICTCVCVCVCVWLGICLVQGERTELCVEWMLCMCAVCSVSGARGVMCSCGCCAVTYACVSSECQCSCVHTSWVHDVCTITHVVHVTLCLCCDVMLRLHVFVVRVHAYCVVTGCTRMIRMMCCVSGVKRMVWYTAHGACVHYVCCACGMVCTCAVRVCVCVLWWTARLACLCGLWACVFVVSVLLMCTVCVCWVCIINVLCKWCVCTFAGVLLVCLWPKCTGGCCACAGPPCYACDVHTCMCARVCVHHSCSEWPAVWVCWTIPSGSPLVPGSVCRAVSPPPAGLFPEVCGALSRLRSVPAAASPALGPQLPHPPGTTEVLAPPLPGGAPGWQRLLCKVRPPTPPPSMVTGL